ncbi:MAG: hypothetical protein HY046_08295 [Acidobacteria bacterium]|nr:hypothetical protein [Acidobacteriota bacterium]
MSGGWWLPGRFLFQFLVATLANNRRVFSIQRKFCRCVREPCQRCPAFGRMALLAPWKRAVVPVAVARKTRAVKPKMRRRTLCCQRNDIRVFDVLERMALHAFDFSVFAGQRKVGAMMVERRLVELRDARVAPEMFFVARGARFSRAFEMQSAPGIPNGLDFRMARKAFVARNLHALFVALNTVAHSFQRYVITREVAGRNLRKRGSDARQPTSYDHR